LGPWRITRPIDTTALDPGVLRAAERLSRLWSVALPAIVITCLLDALSYKLNPAYYSLHWGPYRYIGLHLIANTLFLTQNWGMDIAPLSNSPFWSLSYEAWFYLIFGLSMARRTLWVAIAAILAGPNIMYMMILWLTGVVSFDIFDRLRERRHLIATAAASALLALLLLTIYLRKFEAIGLIYDRLQRGIFGTFHISPRRSREDLIIPGLIAAPMFMAMLCTAKLVGRVVTIPPPVVRISRAAGVFTFPLYLLHFPLLVFCGAVGFYDPASLLQFFLVMLGVCGVVALVTPATSIFKTVIKEKLTRGLASLERGDANLGANHGDRHSRRDRRAPIQQDSDAGPATLECPRAEPQPARENAAATMAIGQTETGAAGLGMEAPVSGLNVPAGDAPAGAAMLHPVGLALRINPFLSRDGRPPIGLLRLRNASA
jgi:peptidoglycan/LPS O-acetylase OafA/YrhL